jgi:hypothetical protein
MFLRVAAGRQATARAHPGGPASPPLARTPARLPGGYISETGGHASSAMRF